MRILLESVENVYEGTFSCASPPLYPVALCGGFLLFPFTTGRRLTWVVGKVGRVDKGERGGHPSLVSRGLH